MLSSPLPRPSSWSVVAGLGLLAGLPAAAGAVGLLSGPVYNATTKHTYYLLDRGTWTECEAAAVQMCGHLVTIDDSLENAFVFDTFSRFAGVERELWIGLSDAAVEGTFTWSSGSSAAYRNFGSGEPNNHGNEDYVHMLHPSDPRADGSWNDWPNSSSLDVYPCNGVVELDAPVLGGPEIRPETGHAYYILQQSTWTAAESSASAFCGGHLVTIEDASENTWITNTFSRYANVERELWIGLTDQAAENQFVWIDGSLATYRNFAAGEPNNNGGKEDWVQILHPSDPHPDGTWNDWSNTKSLSTFPCNGIVELPASPALTAIVSHEPSGTRDLTVQVRSAHGATEIELSLARPSGVRWEVWDARGRHVAAADAGRHEAGVHRLVWQQADARGRQVARGVYWMRVSTDDGSVSRPLVITR